MDSEQRDEQTPSVVEGLEQSPHPVRGRLDRPPGGSALCVDLCRRLPGHGFAPPASQDAVRVPGCSHLTCPAANTKSQARASPRCPLNPLSCSGNKLPQIPVTQAENPGPLLIKPGSLDSVALATCTFFPILLFSLGPRLLYPAIMGPDSWDVYGVR